MASIRQYVQMLKASNCRVLAREHELTADAPAKLKLLRWLGQTGCTLAGKGNPDTHSAVKLDSAPVTAPALPRAPDFVFLMYRVLDWSDWVATRATLPCSRQIRDHKITNVTASETMLGDFGRVPGFDLGASPRQHQQAPALARVAAQPRQGTPAPGLCRSRANPHHSLLPPIQASAASSHAHAGAAAAWPSRRSVFLQSARGIFRISPCPVAASPHHWVLRSAEADACAGSSSSGQFQVPRQRQPRAHLGDAPASSRSTRPHQTRTANRPSTAIAVRCGTASAPNPPPPRHHDTHHYHRLHLLYERMC
ncbi:hypothetical protein MAPG_00346 [Magnaporthiopsis poae ATCC 64411]|uniref:Uncharacterized protein n=1 Tax=Magnaporthiopsis poae (strain ATCC 64411 / 73-15) TaxID=644358 RepID=A0A0C4DKR7_MAGP6|nr:hypothetical protein MAPG_00346 [Magnaporthiopsis poae ATCC 64411]